MLIVDAFHVHNLTYGYDSFHNLGVLFAVGIFHKIKGFYPYLALYHHLIGNNFRIGYFRRRIPVDNALDTAAAGACFNILANGVLPRVPAGAFSGVRACEIRTDGNLVIEEDGSQTPISAAAGNSAAAALSRLYFLFDSGAGYIQQGACPRPGAAFNLTRTTEEHAADGSSLPQPTEVLRIDSSVLVVPFSLPRSFAPVSVRLAFAALSLSQGAAFNVFLAPDYRIALTEETLKNRFLYAEDGNVAGLTRLGSFSSGTSASLAIPDGLLSDGCGTVIITGSFPPELYNLETGGSQGTGPALIPSITLAN